MLLNLVIYLIVIRNVDKTDQIQHKKYMSPHFKSVGKVESPIIVKQMQNGRSTQNLSNQNAPSPLQSYLARENRSHTHALTKSHTPLERANEPYEWVSRLPPPKTARQ